MTQAQQAFIFGLLLGVFVTAVVWNLERSLSSKAPLSQGETAGQGIARCLKPGANPPRSVPLNHESDCSIWVLTQ